MNLGILGCGKMGTALVTGAIRAQSLHSSDVTGFDPAPAAMAEFTRTTGAHTATSPADLAARCDTLLLCTKPQDATRALATLALAPDHPLLVISIAAGLATATLEKALPPSCRVIRCMPTTPALVGQGAAAFCRGSRATDDDARTAATLLGAVGLAIELPESLLDAVTGLSGSGPAFVFTIIEAMADAGVRCGLPREHAARLAAQTVLGAATMVLTTGLHPAVLRDQVTSPGGTTIAGLAELERHGLRSALIDAVTAATRRATELGRPVPPA